MSLDFLHGLGLFGIIPFLVVLTIVVFFHELGHFLVARRCGVKVETFSIGFGPELFGFNDRHGTRWMVAAIPLGGYVKFFGDENAASEPDHAAIAAMTAAEQKVSFVHKSVGQRSAIVAAGPFANFVLSTVIFAALLMSVGRQILPARVDDVLPDSAAAAAGIKPGDVIIAIDGQPIASFSEMQLAVSTSGGRTLAITIDRSGQRVDLQATPSARGYCSAVLGITHQRSPTDEVVFRREGPIQAIGMGADATYLMIKQQLCFVAGVLTGRESARMLGGPIGIAKATGDAWDAGLDNGGLTEAIVQLLTLTGGLSAAIGLLNLFPIPLLDGGHLLFFGLEAARGRPVSERVREVGARIGLAIVLLLFVFATYNDIVRRLTS